MKESGRGQSLKEKAASSRMNIADKPSLKDAGKEIRLNLFVQLCATCGILLLYVFLRTKLPWIYCANTKRSKSHPAERYSGKLDWIVPVFTISDSDFFNLVGFDAFLFIETLKLLFLIFLFLSLTVFPCLGAYYYYFGRDGEELDLLMRVSLLPMPKSHRTANAIAPSVCIWVVSFAVIYFLYMFYRKYVILRQIHLKDRTFSKSIPSIKRIAGEFDSVSEALREIYLPSKTVLIRNLPTFVLGREDLVKYLEELGVSVKPTECHVVINTKALKFLVEQRQETIRLLEMDLQLVLLEINKLSLDSDLFQNTVEGYDPSIDLISNAIAWQKTSGTNFKKSTEDFRVFGTGSQNKKQRKKKQKEVTRVIKKLFFCEFLEKLSPKITTINKRVKNYISTIETLNKKIGKERELAAKSAATGAESIPRLVKQNKPYDSYDIDRNEPIFFSFRNVLRPRASYTSFIRSMPVGTKNGFLTFSTAEEANVLKISFIGTSIFSCKAIEAPPPSEIIWPALIESEATRILKKFIGSVCTFFFVSLFIIFVFLVSTLININTFDSIVSWVNPQLEAITKQPTFRAAFQAILMPLVYSVLLSLAPTAIESICLFEGSISHSELQRRFGEKYSFFLFVNGFLVLIFGATIVSFITREKEDASIFSVISVPVVSSSIFFLNTLIQKTFTTMALFLVEPGRILAYLLSNLLEGIRTRRDEIESIEPAKINFGYLYPQIFLMFPMVLIYTVVCPWFILFGALHFFGAFIVFKTLFMYSHISNIESGGEHWPSLCSNFFYSLITFQIITVFLFLSLRQYVVFGLVIPLIIITVGIGRNFKDVMSKKCNFLPNSHKEIEENTKFVKRLSNTRTEEIKKWQECEFVEKDLLVLSKKAKKPAGGSYIYKDHSLLPASTSAVLPQWFYTTFLYLKKNGSREVFKSD